MSLSLDHVVIRVPEPDALAERISQATGLPVLRGWTPGGTLTSRGVRFANGPFLDIFPAPEPQPSPVGLAGSVEAVEALAAARDWRIAGEPEAARFPWKLAAFKRRQGALSAFFVVDYDRQAPAWADEEFSGALFDPAASTPGTARLVGVQVAGSDPRREDIAALGGFDLANATLTVDVGPVDGAAVLEVITPSEPSVRELQLTPSLVMRLRAAPAS
jgi:hypothetical protein